MDTKFLLKETTINHASDLYVVAGRPPTMKLKGRLLPFDQEPLTPAQTEAFVKELYTLADNRDFNKLQHGDDDFGVSIEGSGRYRVNAYRQDGSFASVIRTIPLSIPDPAKLGIPEIVVNLANNQRGIVLFTGTTGSGKSTSLACLVDKINTERENHIITIEDPVEFRHPHKKSIISQREIEIDTESYGTALRAAMRQVPDVILLAKCVTTTQLAQQLPLLKRGIWYLAPCIPLVPVLQ